MALDRYVTKDAERRSKSPRERLYDLQQAHRGASGGYVKREEKAARKGQERQDRNWGSSAAQGAIVGAMASGGNPWGALIGAGVGTVKGMANAFKSRRGSGQGTLEAIGRTLFDVEGSLPTGMLGMAGAQAAGNAVQGWQRSQAGGNAYDSFNQLAERNQYRPGEMELYSPQLGDSGSSEFGLGTDALSLDEDTLAAMHARDSGYLGI